MDDQVCSLGLSKDLAKWGTASVLRTCLAPRARLAASASTPLYVHGRMVAWSYGLMVSPLIRS